MQFLWQIIQRNLKSKQYKSKGNCQYNEVIEKFFVLLKSELFYFYKFKSIEDFREKLDEYIDYYNNRRIKVKLKGLSPVEYQTKSLRTA